MTLKFFLSLCVCSAFSLFGTVDHSIIPLMNQTQIKNLKNQLHPEQLSAIDEISSYIDYRLRIVSFNMLFNCFDENLKPENRWGCRKERVIEYIEWANPDIIGSQELQVDQLKDILCVIGADYAYYGMGIKGEQKGDISAIFYRKDRLELLQGKTYYFSETPEEISDSPFNGKNTFTVCHLKDLQDGKEFLVINTHLAFRNLKRRYYEACKLRDFLSQIQGKLPIILTGDFNTFPFRQELDLPFYDGDRIIAVIEEGLVANTIKMPLFGHFGPIASTNYCTLKKEPFCTNGNPGVILDHIFVNSGVIVLSHGIDPAKVDGRFPSDHFPVIVDILLK